LGWLFTSSEVTTKPLFETFLGRMRELGYVTGKNLLNDLRWAEGNSSRYAALADELIALKPDVLLGIQEAARILKAKTSVIPIVLLASSDPVAVGLVQSLARPGANVTGMAGLYDQLLAKQIDLLKEIFPRMARVGFLSDSRSATHAHMEKVAHAAASATGLALIVAAAHDLPSIGRAFAEFRKQRAEALVVTPTGPMAFFRREIADEASRLRLPSISGLNRYAESGGLLNYSPDTLDSYRNEIPLFVDRILKGAKPADLPVQQMTRYELVVNMKTARELGVTMPRSILLRANLVIE
jgi:ABC-type uncharacterized transport system substrate-binding protein